MEMYFNTTALAIILGYYIVINLVLYITMVIDKKRAIKDGWRIPEKNMFIMAVLGGGLGGLCAMVFKRHKNRHLDFIMVFTMTSILHMVAALLLIGKFAFIMH
ncbi:MAG: DUF1294 domain-containing protein [Anaerotignum sp.]|nr:DUF1294 domain-containing protein [Anaerotignum sp.]MBR5793983.1 DUF1294 domain-containing protein [Anaerotignum sp.]